MRRPLFRLIGRQHSSARQHVVWPVVMEGCSQFMEVVFSIKELREGRVCACRTKWSFILWIPMAAVGRAYDGCQL